MEDDGGKPRAQSMQTGALVTTPSAVDPAALPLASVLSTRQYPEGEKALRSGTVDPHS